MDALRISPKYTSDDWRGLNRNSSDDWSKAARIVWDRLDGRFLSFASNCLKQEFSGFVVLAIDCLLVETIQQFKEGITNGRDQSGKMVKRFLCGKQFQPYFNEKARKSFYEDIRCGLLHQAEAKKKWLVRRNQRCLLQPIAGGEGYIIDVQRFHDGVRSSLKEYLDSITDPASSDLREKLWVKMNDICNVREARGALYEAAEGLGAK